jgi:putative acetyltransferase
VTIDETATAVVLRVVSWDHPDSVELCAAQRAEISARYGGGLEAGHPPSAADIAMFVVAYDDAGTPIGCGGFRDLRDEQPTVEVKRMYVRPNYRGRKIGQLILRDLEIRARQRGAVRVRLETGTLLPEALRLYEGAGYQRIPNFGDYVDDEGSLCYERTLM